MNAIKTQYRPALKSSLDWRDYFEQNRAEPRAIPWHLGANLATVEREQIASSLQEFQIGENCDGPHLLRAASQFAVREEDSHYVAAMRLFIGEKRRHARELGRFLDLAGIPRRSNNLANKGLRQCRHPGGLEASIIVLVTFQIIASAYYAALRDATGSPVLRSICDLVLMDDALQLRFHCERLAILRRKRPRWLVSIAENAQRLFLRIACIIVWHRHGSAIRAGGLTWPVFRARIKRIFNRAQIYMMPVRNREWTADVDDDLTDPFRFRDRTFREGGSVYWH